MSDYKETSVTGTSWQRCNVVHINNAYGTQPIVTFAEEVVATLGADTFIKPSSQLVFPFDPAVVIELRNPADNTLTGATMTGLDVYVALYSLYIQKANERDLTA